MHNVGELTRGHSSDEGIGSEYDLAQYLLSDDVDLGMYRDNHERAKQARQLLGRVTAVLDTIREAKIGDLNWKDVPWANPSNTLPVPKGAGAAIPETDEHGNKTGEFIVLEHDEYMGVLGTTGMEQPPTSGDPDEILRKLRSRSTGGAKQQVPTKPIISEGMKK
jgi:hypothetical protein